MAGLLKGIRKAQAGPRDGNGGAFGNTGDLARQRLELFASFEESGTGWFWTTDSAGNLTYLSERIAEHFGKDASAMLGMPFVALFRRSLGREEGAQRSLPLMMAGQKAFSGLTARAGIPGTEIVWSVSGRPQFADDGTFTGYRGFGMDAVAPAAAGEQNPASDDNDPLTGLIGRQRMIHRLNSLLAAFRAAQRSCGLMVIDIDHFGEINERLGQSAGDDLLREMGQRLRGAVDSQCEIARVGADEFQIILPDLDDRGRLGEIAKKIITLLSQPYSLAGGRTVVGASIGMAIAPYDGINREELVRSAAIALDAAQSRGGGQFSFYSNDLQSDVQTRANLAGELKEALGKGEISLRYQPIVDAGNDRIVGFEALMRWHHPERGDVPTAEFLPLAKDNGLILTLGEWALRTACEDALQWPDKLRVVVNISSAELANEGFPRIVASALATSGLAPHRLELDLGESVFLSECGATDGALRTLGKLGVRLALDDFGTGLVSFEHLSRMPFDCVKIDRGFLRGAVKPESRNAAVIGAMVALADAMGMETVMEGVEALDELDLVRAKGVRNVQGFVYCAAMPQDEVCARLRQDGDTIRPTGPRWQREERRTLLRKMHVIHEDHCYDVTLRNLSRTGAMIEGLADVPVGTEFVLDFGEGQLAVATVRRAYEDSQGLEFENALVDDGAGGLCTRHRVSPYALAAAGMPLAMLPPGQYPLFKNPNEGTGFTMPRFARMNRHAEHLGQIGGEG